MGKLTAVKTAESFYTLLERSKLLGEEPLAKLKEDIADLTDPRDVARLCLKQQLLTRWQATQLLNGFAGLRVGKYKLCDLLGVGPVGRVFLAEHPTLGRRVALKTVSRQFTKKKSLLDRFLDESRQAAALDHRNLVHVYDVDVDDERYFMVTEYVDGSDLCTLVEKSGPRSLPEAMEIVRQAADGLSYAHAESQLHRDIKPGNLILDRQGVLKILDLGFGGLLQMQPEELESAAGPHCSAPEQVRGEPVDHRADIFGLGCVFYWLLTGKEPFPGHGEFPQPPSIAELRKDVPEQVVDLCRRMIAIDPRQRLNSAAQIAEELAQFAARPNETQKIPTEDTQVVDEAPAGPPAASAPPELKKPAKAVAGPAPVKIGPPPQMAAGQEGTATEDAGTADAGAATDVFESAAFVIETKRRRKGAGKPARSSKQPAAKRGAASPTAETSESPAAQGNSPASAAAPQPAAPQPASAEPAIASSAVPKSAKSPGASKRIWILAAAAGGALAMVGIIALLSFLFLAGDGQTKVAENKEGAAEPPIPSPASSGLDISDPVIGDPEIGDPEIGDPNNGEAATTIGDPAEVAPAGGATNTAGENDPKSAEPKATEPGKTEPGKTEPGKTEPGKTEPGKSEPGKTEPGKTEPGKTEPKPPAKTEPKKAEPKPPADPLKSLARQLDLPPLFEDDQPRQAGLAATKLGRIGVDDKELVFIRMSGGDSAIRGKVSFTIRNAEGGLAERDWEVVLSGAKELPEQAVVAKLALQGQDLSFQWMPDAVKDPTSQHLGNCILNVSVGGQTRDVALRKSRPVEAIVLNLDKSGSQTRIEIPLPPDPDRVRVEITALEDGFPAKFTKEPEQPLNAAKDTQHILLGEKPEDQVLLLKVDATMKRGLELTVTPFLQPSKNAKPQRLTKASFTSLQKDVQAFSMRANAKVQFIAKAKPPKDKRLQQQFEQGKNLASQEAESAAEAVKKVEALTKLYAAINNKGRIQFRVFYATENGEVELAHSK